MRLKEYKIINFVIAFIIIFSLWQIIAMIISKPLFPPPYAIVINIFRTFHKDISIHVIYSFNRIMVGILFTLAIGVPVGILMGYFKKIDLIFSPIIYFNYPIPKIALLPIVMLIFGLGDLTKIVMIFLITFFPVVVNIRDEVKNIPEDVFYPMYSLGATNFQIIKEIVFPGILKAILTSLRIGIGTAISVLFFTENFGTEYGMGYFIMDSWMRINYIQMYSGILILSIIGLFFFIIIDILEGIFCPWI
ncbi:ABC transporter permease [Clostridium sp. CM028]|uniref:ABC transporter permease n=1 Tax=Clostridium TaxID=1485 RepID=UPI0013EEADBD|nr:MULTISPECIES: ABC transporter permease [Clostridium]MBW9149492.1 ABC transporter permease [Clostridium sp. CM028]MBZ9608022.1 ABC transporter permease [Clostridium estertheticum]WLC62155.1 ABC transporter permease [Clostridium sp. CM028]